jgi:hypothetical protein
MANDSWKLAPGLSHVGAYQVSGRPFASGSCLAPVSGATKLRVGFPRVTKWVQIEPRALTEDSAGRQLRVAFSENGLHDKGGWNFVVHASSSLRGPLDLKVSELWFMSEDSTVFEFNIVAGLTNIPSSRTETDDRTISGIVTAAGPNWSGSVGVG